MEGHLGKRIHEWRRKRNMKQLEVERLADLSPTALSRIEKGERAVSADELQAIAKALRVDIKVLHGVEQDAYTMEEDPLLRAITGLRSRCSAKQRQALAELLRTVADELAPTA